MKLTQIGIVRSPISSGIDQGWSNITSEIEILAEYLDGLKGLSDFSHILVIFFMDRSSFDKQTDLIRRPQGREDMPEIGIFAQRAKHRPNPIGVTAVKLIEVKDNIIKVSGLDAIDGTPVLDIKPYFPQFDRIDNPVTPDWVAELMKHYF